MRREFKRKIVTVQPRTVEIKGGVYNVSELKNVLYILEHNIDPENDNQFILADKLYEFGNDRNVTEHNIGHDKF